jgi:hypothetical protein
MQSMAFNNAIPLNIPADNASFGLKWLLLVHATVDVHAK